MIRFLAVSLIAWSTSHAQDIPDTALARATYDRAFQHHLAAEYDKAMAGFREAALIYERAGLWKQWVRCTNQRAEALRMLGKLKDAERVIDSSHAVVHLRIPSDSMALADVLYTKGIMYYSKGDFYQSLACHERAYASRRAGLKAPHKELASSLNNLGIVNYHLGRYDQALDWHARALEMRRMLYGDDHLEVGQSYVNIGVVYRITFQLSKSLDCYERARTAYEKALGADHPRTAIVLHNIGIVYDLMGDFDQALDFYQKALRIRLDKLGPDHPDVAFSYNDIANLHNNQKNYTVSLRFQQQALAVAEKKWRDRHPFVAALHNNMANNWLELGRIDSAETTYRLAQGLNRQLLGDEHPETIRGYDYLGRVFLKRGFPDSALVYFETALHAYRRVFGERHPDIASNKLEQARAWLSKNELDTARRLQEEALGNIVSSKNIDNGPSVSEWMSEKVGLDVLIGLAQTHIRQFRKSGDTLHARDATTRLEQALNLVEQMRHGYRSEGSKLILAESSHRVFGTGIEAAWELYRTTNDVKALENAWTWAERGKAVVLREALADAQARRFAGLPDSLLDAEEKLREDLALTDTQLQQEILKGSKRDTTRIAALSDRLFALKEDARKMTEHLESTYPRYYESKYRIPEVSLAAVQKTLSPREAIIHYTLGDSAWYAFVITSEKINGYRWEPDSALEVETVQLRRAMAGLDFFAYAGLASRLYDRLIRPLNVSDMTRLTIVPDRFLHLLPFEALLTRPSNGPSAPDFTQLPYLIRQVSIRYVPSATLIRHSDTKKAPSLLAMAPVFSDSIQRFVIRAIETEETDSARRGAGRLSALPFSRLEVEAIAGLFRQRGYHRTVFISTSATKSNFLASCEDARIIHIATHGFLNGKNIKLSGIVFALHSDSSDPVLYVPEIYNLKMDADLVTLSACKTGLGDVVRGEGIIGLTRALTYAGAQRTLVSLWPVADRATSDLMTNFYMFLLDGASYAEALRLAKLELIRMRQYAFPGDWASFILIDS
jgi:CHAT domain-containing protein/Tfp pilus assembly protein PilF